MAKAPKTTEKSSETDSSEKSLPETEANFKFEIDEECYVKYRQVAHKERWYFSRVLKRTASKDNKTGETILKYFVHYKGWNHRWDIWQREEFLLKDTPKNKEHAEKLHLGLFDAPVDSPKKIKPKPSPKRVISTEKEFPKSGQRKLFIDPISGRPENSNISKILDKSQNRKRNISQANIHSYVNDEFRLQKLPKLNKSIIENLAYKNLKPSLPKKCDKSEAQESFHKDNDNFDVIEAPLDCDEVLRGDNFDMVLTTELMEIVELEMMKITKRSYLPNLPCKVSICDIFDNYIHWHLTEEILKNNGISRRTQMYNEDVMNSATRSYRICGVPLSYAQELSRAIQICQTFINLFYDSHWFYCNLLYDSESPNFNKILSSAKWSKFSSPLKKSKSENLSKKSQNESRRASKSTRSKILSENYTIKRSTFWFLNKTHSELRAETSQFIYENEIQNQNLLWLFDAPVLEMNSENFSFLKPYFSDAEAIIEQQTLNSDLQNLDSIYDQEHEKWINPGVPHIYGGRHLLRFFSHWIYKAGFLDRIFQGILKDWQMEALEAQMESIMRFMFEYKEFCVPDLDTQYSRAN